MSFIKRFSFAKISNSLPASLTNNTIGQPFVELLRVDSTNNYAMGQLKKGLAMHGTAYFAYEQTAGKGQRNKQWQSVKGENIILSVVLDTKRLLTSHQFTLSMIAALSAQNLFNKYTTNETKIKWPNDIYWRDRKAGGILIENVFRGANWQFAIVGFGLNINQTIFDASLKNPVSLKQITGSDYDVIPLAKELCKILEFKFSHFSGVEEGSLLNEYNNGLYKRNEETRFKKESRVFSGDVKRVDSYGRLIISSSTEEAYEFGEIEWLID
jgi:BirA family biotin operon repressor/biotin-[acetyl-CoA-carboxylase] ligase